MSRAPRLVILLLALVAALAGCGLDPVHDGQLTALGPEQPGVPPGPEHRPGQPCLDCHGGSGPAKEQFSAGGTVYEAQTGAPVPLYGGTVTLVDTNGVTTTATTNDVGNFWVPQSAWAPAFPVHVTTSYKSNSQPMNTHVGRNASCASCHYDPPGPQTPGHVYLVFQVPDGGL